MTKMYVVMSRHYEYNDETYENTEGGNCLTVYNNEEDADDAARTLFFNMVKNSNDYIFEYNQWSTVINFDDCELIAEYMKENNIVRYDEIGDGLRNMLDSNPVLLAVFFDSMYSQPFYFQEVEYITPG